MFNTCALSAKKALFDRPAFIPKDKLEQNTLYQITFHLSEVTNKVSKELKNFNFSVKTIKQDFIVNTQDLQSYSKDWYYLNGNLKTADNLSFEDAQKIIEATQNNKKLKINFDKSKNNCSVESL
jgi:hypothetical protein